MNRVVVIGVGNPWRGDDAIGPEIARRLSADPPRGVGVFAVDGEPSALIETWRGRAAAILIDAEAGAGPAGAVRRRDLLRAPCPAMPGHASGHGLGIAYALGLARALGALPARLVLYTVRASRFDLGAPLSPTATRAIRPLCRAVRREAERLVRQPPAPGARGARATEGQADGRTR